MEILDNPTQEQIFDLWTEELIKEGYIDVVYKQGDFNPFVLSNGLHRTISNPYTVYKGTKREEQRIKTSKEVIFNGLTYSPDRLIVWNNKAIGIFCSLMKEPKDTYFYCQHSDFYDGYVTYVDVKAPPGYGKLHASDEGFRYAQKWVWEKFDVLVNKCVLLPSSSKKRVTAGMFLFIETFLPERMFFTDKTFKPRTINHNVRTINKFLSLKS